MSVLLMWAIILLVLGLALVVLEAFLPTGGLLGILAAVAVIAAVVLAFQSGIRDGILLMAAAGVGVPVSVMLGLKIWPHTPIGRRVLLQAPSSEEVLPDSPQRRQLRDLLGKTGRARSMMLPSGSVLIDGRVIDALSEGVAIDEGQPVRVVEVRGFTVVVRPIDEEELNDNQQKSAEPSDDVLSRPIESLGIDPFGDTAA